MKSSRRQWLKTIGAAATGGVLENWACPPFGITSNLAAEENPQPQAAAWTIGCFNRPWSRWRYDDALDGIRSAGFRVTGLLGDHKDEPFTSPTATSEYVDRLRQRIESRGLTVLCGWLRTTHDIAVDESIAQARRQILHAQRLGMKYMLTVGVDPPEQHEHFFRVMADAAAFAHDRGIQIVLKPHGGCSASSREILHCVDRVKHANFRVWFDAGNIIHYTGKDPLAELEPIVELVTGFCAKDCAAPRGDVMLPFGAGKVNFAAIFARLKAARFRGPIMVECCGGNTLPEVTAGAKANREYLERQ